MNRTRIRHWKQHWDPKADFVFLKKLRMGDDPKNPYVLVGDSVTTKMREKMGPARLRRWWEAQIIGRADFDLRLPQSPREGVNVPAAKTAGILKVSPGWYMVTSPDGTERKVHGKKKAEDALAEVMAAYDEALKLLS